ncbi:hypothetical protein DERF_011467 [Dermatophagoides farinae]|uniref:Uncharacterized protein n=1 Tax=Dermatophagoides farinae TaxID=6954 RepID=A0A922HVG8_DERFA|nr:hypothetical protein DERF_011467 [Dermatophagoides farinae]
MFYTCLIISAILFSRFSGFASCHSNNIFLQVTFYIFNSIELELNQVRCRLLRAALFSPII